MSPTEEVRKNLRKVHGQAEVRSSPGDIVQKDKFQALELKSNFRTLWNQDVSITSGFFIKFSEE